MVKLEVSSSPHIRDRKTTRSLMRDVVIALCPAVVAAGFLFGIRAISLILVSVASCLLFEALSRKIMRREQTIGDLSAVVTGILLAFNLPPTLPYYMVVIGAFFAIVVAKQFFGGIGNNFANPALIGRIVLTIGFSSHMTSWTRPAGAFDFIASLRGADLVTSATPLALLRESVIGVDAPTHTELFLGLTAGCIGEVCALALLIGAAYLLIRKVIALWIPLSFIGTVVVLSLLSGIDPFYAVLSGGLLLGAFYMATDYATSPMTVKGKIIFGIGCGLITALIRIYGNMTEGVTFGILFMNLLTPHIERLTMPRPFGEEKKRGKTS